MGRVSLQRVDELCRELRSGSSRISEADAGELGDQLERVRSTYSACDQAGGVQSACSPFFQKSESLMRECRNV